MTDERLAEIREFAKLTNVTGGTIIQECADTIASLKREAYYLNGGEQKVKPKKMELQSHGSLQEQYKEKMRSLAIMVDDYFNGATKPKVTGFALLVFPFGQPDGEHRANYISNANREDMLATMKEFIARAEGRYVATHEDIPEG